MYSITEDIDGGAIFSIYFLSIIFGVMLLTAFPEQVGYVVAKDMVYHAITWGIGAWFVWACMQKAVNKYSWLRAMYTGLGLPIDLSVMLVRRLFW